MFLRHMVDTQKATSHVEMRNWFRVSIFLRNGVSLVHARRQPISEKFNSAKGESAASVEKKTRYRRERKKKLKTLARRSQVIAAPDTEERIPIAGRITQPAEKITLDGSKQELE